MWTSYLESIPVPILRTGLMEPLMWLLMKNSCLMLPVTLSSLTFRINKRISLQITQRAKRRFVNLGLNSRPTFFGCNASNYTSFSRTPPLVIYFPHTGWTAYTNFSTFTLEYTNADVAAYIDNGVATAVPPRALPPLTLPSIGYGVNSSRKEIVQHGLCASPAQFSNAPKNAPEFQ